VSAIDRRAQGAAAGSWSARGNFAPEISPKGAIVGIMLKGVGLAGTVDFRPLRNGDATAKTCP
jgi:hypothetical protein